MLKQVCGGLSAIPYPERQFVSIFKPPGFTVLSFTVQTFIGFCPHTPFFPHERGITCAGTAGLPIGTSRAGAGSSLHDVHSRAHTFYLFAPSGALWCKRALKRVFLLLLFSQPAFQRGSTVRLCWMGSVGLRDPACLLPASACGCK